MKKINLLLILLFKVFLLLHYNSISAQDTISISIDKAEELFLKKNLFLLAAQCNVDKQNALVIQSKAYPNPVFSANFNMYDPENDIYFHTDKTGQKDFMFEQLIILGGKRKASIDIAKTNKELAEAEFTDILRNLKFQLNKSFYNIYQYQNNVRKFNQQLLLLDTLINAYEIQAAKGNISLKDVIRLKSVYLKINNERAEGIQLLNEENKNIQLLIQEQGIIVPIVNNETVESYTKLFSLDEIETNALSKRPDLLMNNKMIQMAELNYKLQKRTNIPDAVFNVSTDQRGGAFKNQINAGISLPLPLWNYNRGNIKAAKSDVNYNGFMLEERKKEIKAEVLEAYQNMERSIKEYKKSKQLYNANFEMVFKSVNENFAKNNISIIEFVDFIEAYNDALKELERIKSQISINAAQINYVSGTKLY
ncbi:MAG: TolC family protein [Bacteroidia bacterium]|nr:TolC family protein [Bacteroidia bacterium]MDO9001160.1 TolC family protein [Bacteroidota bacterium]MDP3145589.1 TolC family protein [Bacteroidota bacterium]